MTSPAPRPPTTPPRAGPGRVGGGLRLDADLLVVVDVGGIGAVLARAVALGLTDLGLLAPAGELDDWLAAARAGAALSRLRVHCGLVLAADGSADPDRARLSRLDFAVVRGGPGALDAAAGLRLPVLVAGPVLADLPAAALARAGVAAAVTERDRTPPVAVARRLAAAGVPLVAGSAARGAAGVGRWQHVAAVAAAVAPGPRPAPAAPDGTRVAPGPYPPAHPGPATVVPVSTTQHQHREQS